jgi:hypothetical protein
MEIVLDKVVSCILLEVVSIVEFASDRNKHAYSHIQVLTIPSSKDVFFVGAMLTMAL